MKIKEVCERTGLTERTVRFYVEQQLINPNSYEMNGRVYREYDLNDVKALLTIAALRKAFFSIEEIKRMKQSPEDIAPILSDYMERQAADAQAKARLVDALAAVDVMQLSHIDLLADVVSDVASDLPLPRRDIEPNFGKFDGVSEQEREAEIQKFRERQKRQQKVGFMIVLVIAIGNVLASISSLFTSFSFGTMLMLIVQIIFSIALFNGVVWVRYLFAVGAGLNVLLASAALVTFAGQLHLAGYIIVIINILFSAASCILLLISKAVSEFLYAQKNG